MVGAEEVGQESAPIRQAQGRLYVRTGCGGRETGWQGWVLLGALLRLAQDRLRSGFASAGSGHASTGSGSGLRGRRDVVGGEWWVVGGRRGAGLVGVGGLEWGRGWEVLAVLAGMAGEAMHLWTRQAGSRSRASPEPLQDRQLQGRAGDWGERIGY